ncbi:hypothetical protein M1K46_06385 [Fictibacillus sp. WQ 8-8]|uniref:hypothetical protein n=1 Tax=unclassified Fictibacillus TaxID=2644029 RepID=UPI00210AED92|nr:MULTISPECIES: hypothetical protein [unclassified Fictibacillus]MCQ6265287.1 hypothetical protein [Fictibacillus sp. WQ 8-8]MED2971957.1 hypothetical protein [Fictibacillus sp. B-59209]
MNPWLGQLKKEYRLGKGGVLGALIALFLYLGLGVYTAWRMGKPETFFAFCAFAVMMHVVYMAGYLCVSYFLEQKTLHIWLQTPMSVCKLLLAKLVNGFAALALSLFITSVVTLIAGTMVMDIFQFNSDMAWSDVIYIGTFLVIHILLISFYIGLGLTFLWAIYLVTTKNLGKVSGWVIGLGVFFFGPWLLAKWEDTKVFDALFIWGKVNLKYSDFVYGVFKHVYIGYYFYHLLLAIVLFLAASWLIERKVEV